MTQGTQIAATRRLRPLLALGLAAGLLTTPANAPGQITIKPLSPPIPPLAAPIRLPPSLTPPKPLTIAPVQRPPEPVKPWPYGSFGAPGKIVSWRDVPDLGVSQLRFANGVRLNIKPTTFTKGQVLVTVRVGQGLLAEPAGRFASSWLAAAAIDGGTTEMTYQEQRRALQDTVTGLGVSEADDALILLGGTRQQDLARQLQWMTAAIRWPAYRPEAFARLKVMTNTAVSKSLETPSGILELDLPVAMHGGDARWRSTPTPEEIAAATPADAIALTSEALKSGAIEVTVVGDVSPSDVAAQVAATLGTLPQRREPPPITRDLNLRPPAGGPLNTYPHHGRPEQAIAFVEWPLSEVPPHSREFRALNLAAAILRTRLADRLNAGGPATYAPEANIVSSYALPRVTYLWAAVAIPPWKSDETFAAVTDIVADLGRSTPPEDELKRAVEALGTAEVKAKASNLVWVGMLGGSQADPSRLEALRDTGVPYDQISGDDIVTAVRSHMAPDMAWRLIVRSPEAPVPTLGPTAPATLMQQAGGWPQTTSDLKADDHMRFGMLPNGMRYAIKRNTTPSGATSLRFRIAAGSLHESEDQRGLAHFLEHMAFRGSTHVAQNEMVRILERKGLSFGPDINAFTQRGQTFYKLDLPRSDDDYLDTGLMLMREIGSELLIDGADVDAERGVVLAEERLDASPAREAEKAEEAFYLQGQLAGRRDPMGGVDIVASATTARLRAFYNAYYRPENATLIVVGDVDPALMEKRIIAAFGGWRGRGPAGPQPALGAPAQRGLNVRAITADGLVQALTIAWVRPFDRHADTFARQRRDLVQAIGLDVLNTRFLHMSADARAAFVSAQASRTDWAMSASIAQVGGLPAALGFDAMLDSLVAEQRRIAEFGVSEKEFHDALAARRDSFGSAMASADSALSGAIADQELEAVDQNRVIMSPAAALAQFDVEARTVTLDDVNRALRTSFTGSGPLIVVTSPVPVPGGESVIRDLYAAAANRGITPPKAQDAIPWPYAQTLAAPGHAVWRRDISDLGVTEIRFANGVRLNVMPTTFARNQIAVNVRIGGGLLGQAANAPGQAWLLGAFGAGGAREMTVDDIQRSLHGKGVTFTAAMGEDAFVVSGLTSPRDLATQMELLTAMISRPGYRAEAVDHLKELLSTELPTVDYSPEGVLALELQPLLHGGDRRWRALPTPQDLRTTSPADLSALIDPALRSGAIEVAVIGDVTPEQAIAEVGRTLGSLPKRAEPKAVPASSPTIRPPSGTGGPPVSLHHKGRKDQAIAYLEWPTTDFYADRHEAHVLVLTADVLQNRLLDRVRIREGVSYAPTSDAYAASEEIGFGYLQVTAEVPPARIDTFFSDVGEIVGDLCAQPPSADELLRARAPRIESETRSRQTLAYWTSYIGDLQADPREVESIRVKIPDFQSVTPAELSAACRKYLTPDRAWKLTVTPAAP